MGLGVLAATLRGANVAAVVPDTCDSQALASSVSMSAGGLSPRERFRSVANRRSRIESGLLQGQPSGGARALLGCWTLRRGSGGSGNFLVVAQHHRRSS